MDSQPPGKQGRLGSLGEHLGSESSERKLFKFFFFFFLLDMVNFTRNFQTVFYIGCNIWQSHEPCIRMSLPLHPCQQEVI